MTRWKHGVHEVIFSMNFSIKLNHSQTAGVDSVGAVSDTALVAETSRTVGIISATIYWCLCWPGFLPKMQVCFLILNVQFILIFHAFFNVFSNPPVICFNGFRTNE